MRAFCITLEDSKASNNGFNNLVHSSEIVDNSFDIERFAACTPEEVSNYPKIRWNWPWYNTEICFSTGIRKIPYPTVNQKARIACFISHWRLWNKCVNLNEQILILEHDAWFIRKIPESLKLINGCILALNDPRGNTRRSQHYHEIVQAASLPVTQAPYIDADRSIAQGLPGNSAYIITPGMAQGLLDFTAEHGAWPNDAMICNQNFPGKLYIYKDYRTITQNMRSSTSS